MVTLLDAVKMAYRKHHLDDPTIGWDELDNCLLSALCNEMGDEAFQKWLLSTRDKRPHAVFPSAEVEEDEDKCYCGEPFPENGKCDFCGAHARYGIAEKGK